jgi:HAD superfamily hydrolase (TIGR01484 family)
MKPPERRIKPFAELPAEAAARVRFVLTDVDDTLTDGPRLSAATYGAMERLRDAGIAVIPVTAAPAGWCDLMCRMWPVGAVIGENGGLCFYPDPAAGVTRRHYWLAPGDVAPNIARLCELAPAIRSAIPGAQLAHDQRYRETTLAFQHRDAALSGAIQARLAAAGARTTVNSLWVLGWFGDFDKLAMARRMMAELFALDIDSPAEAAACLYVGDSLNDAPMFGFFTHSVGVANVRQYLDRLPSPPKWIARRPSGAGFAEIAERLLAART